MGTRSFVSIFKTSAFKIVLMLGLFLTSTVIILAIFLGQESGLFVVRVQNTDLEKTIALCEKIEDGVYYPKLVADGRSNMTDTSPEYFIENDYRTIKEYYNGERVPVISDENGNSLYLYRFYVVNTGTAGVGVTMSMDYNNVTNHLDDVIRVMTYYEISGTQHADVYQKPDEVSYDYKHYDAEGLKLHTFKSGSVVFDDQTITIDSQEGNNYCKVMLLVWIEGQDPDSDKYGKLLYNGTMNFSMSIKVTM